MYILINMQSSLVFIFRVKIYSLGTRKLIYKNKAVAEKHNIKAQKLLQFNKVDKKLNRIEED